jgi:hypothetical protein
MNARSDHSRHSFAERRNTTLGRSSPIETRRVRLPGRGSFLHIARAGQAHAVAFGHVVLIKFAAAVDSLWLVPGFGQPSGAVMLRSE